ncbi:MAG: tetratricopeptide repeat protein [Candidatus Rhabdochlamydia sp.]
MKILNQEIHSLRTDIISQCKSSLLKDCPYQTQLTLNRVSHIAIPILQGLNTLCFQSETLRRCFSVIIGYCITIAALPLKALYSHSHMTSQIAHLTAKQLECLYQIKTHPHEGHGYLGLAFSCTTEHQKIQVEHESLDMQKLYNKGHNLDPSLKEHYAQLNLLPPLPLLTMPKQAQQNRCLQMIHLHSDDAQLYFDLAITLNRNESVTLLDGQQMTEQQLYLKTIDLNPNFVDAYFNLAQLLSSQSQITLLNQTIYSKKNLLLKCLQLGDQSAEVYYELGHLMKNQETLVLHDKSTINKKVAYGKAMIRNSNYSYAYYHLALILEPNEQLFIEKDTYATRESVMKRLKILDPQLYRSVVIITDSNN